MTKTIKELKEFLNQFNEDEKFYIAVDNDNEVTCEFMTESEIIDKANEMGGYEEEETEDKFTDIDDAITYLADMDAQRFYYELEI